MYDIIIGRDKKDREKFGTKGTIFIGRQYVTMGQTTALSNNVYLDMVRSHILFICGKRGSGKSYTQSVIAEGVSDLPIDIKENLSIIFLDTMGIFWTMKYPNRREKDLLKEWNLEPKSCGITIYTPSGFHNEYLKKGIPTDKPFSIQPSDLDVEDWCMTFDVPLTSDIGVLIERTIQGLNQSGRQYGIEDIISAIKEDKKSAQSVKDAVENRFVNALNWGIFEKYGTPLKDISVGGQVSVLDISAYSNMGNGWAIKSLVVGLLCKKLFIERMKARKEEEYIEVKAELHFEAAEMKKNPLVWLLLDEAHEFLPKEGKTTASNPLITILREGRQPGISLILASQQPGKIHSDVMTQSDAVISHRLTAEVDIEALSLLMQSYMREGLNIKLDALPRESGAALIFDDTNERLFPVKIRPKFSWHGGESPTAMTKKKEDFTL